MGTLAHMSKLRKKKDKYLLSPSALNWFVTRDPKMESSQVCHSHSNWFNRAAGTAIQLPLEFCFPF